MTPIKSIADLIPDARNTRRHNPRNVGMIVSALHEVGAARSGVIDEDGNILAGNGTAEALAQAGIERVKVVDAKGDEWVVVRRTGLSAEQKRKLSFYDNRTAELADWDADELLRSVGEGLDLSGLWTAEELKALTAGNPEGREYDETVGDGLDLKARFTVICPQEIAPKVLAVIERLKLEIPELTFKQDEMV